VQYSCKYIYNSDKNFNNILISSSFYPESPIMRLITHNMLKCNIRGVENGYPLKIEAEEVEVIEAEYDVDLVSNLLRKVRWDVVKQAAVDLGIDDIDGVDAMSEEILGDDDIMRKIHHVLLEVHVKTGNLVCPESGRKFPIRDRIPNMLLHEDEV
jgi:multifunctional methyltransferase subunit TRM112